MQRPIVAISTDVDIPERISVKKRYVDAVIQAGGIPFLLPFTEDEAVLQAALEIADALLLTGGDDVCPDLYGEDVVLPGVQSCRTRDEFDYALLRHANTRGMPVLGICRGMQVINTFFGGTLYQDLSMQNPSEICHKSLERSSVAEHVVCCLSEGFLYSLISKKMICVSSIHHQAVKKLAQGFVATAFAKDGVVEAFEAINDNVIWGVQFHPELEAVAGDEDMRKIFSGFVALAGNFKAR